MKQTAIQFLLENIVITSSKNLVNIIKQSIEMEKQQLIDCGNTCALMQHIHEHRVSQMSIEEVEKLAEEDNITFGEQYYDETFKSEQDNE